MDITMQNQIDEINKKLDIILEEIEKQKNHRIEMEDFKEDFLRVGRDLYKSVIEELEEVKDHIQSGDILYLSKKILRNINNLTKTFEMLESTKDFLKDFGPISKELVLDLMKKLDEFERKGYFDYLSEVNRAIDNVVTSFTVDDVRHLADNIVTILNVIKNLTQPEILHALNNAIMVYQKLDVRILENISLISLLKELNSKETKRSLYFALLILKQMTQNRLNKSN